MNLLEMDDFKVRVLRDALACASMQSASTRDRALAASVAADICDHVEFTEALGAAIMRALSSCLDIPQAAEHLVDVVRRKVPDKNRLTGPLERLAAGAFERRQYAGLNVLLLVMLDDNDSWAASAREEWVEKVLWWSSGRLQGGRDLAGELLTLWVSRYGARHEWLRRLIQHAPVLLSSRWLSFTQRQEITFAVPTAWAWRHFAFHHAPDLEPWTTEGFGDQRAVAVETLQAAMTEAEQAGDGGGAVILAGWLAGLLGAE